MMDSMIMISNVDNYRVVVSVCISTCVGVHNIYYVMFVM